MAVSAGRRHGHTLTELNAADDELEHGWPHALPDGSIVFTVRSAAATRISKCSRRKESARGCACRSSARRSLSRPDTSIYSFLGNLMAVRFDLDEARDDGVPAAIAKGIQTSTGFGALGRSGFAVSRTGTLVWLRAGADEGKSRLVRVARDGKVSPLAAPTDVLQTPRLSPDGRRLAVVARSGVMTREIRVLDAAQPDRVTLTIQGGDNQSPAWMDSRRLTFGSNRDGLQKIYVVSVDQKRPPVPLFTADATTARNPASWARERLLALYEIEPARGRNVLVYRIGESIAPVAATGANERSPASRATADGSRTSPTRRDATKCMWRDSIAAGEAMQVTKTGATEPVWAREGLFYREGESVMLRALESGKLG